jgi:hypothetical protein
MIRLAFSLLLCASAASAEVDVLMQLAKWSGSVTDGIGSDAAALKRSAQRRRAADPDGYKPSGLFNDQATAKLMCGEMSRRAAKRGVKVLVVGFEGFASFDSLGTSAAYRYQMSRASERAAARPIPIPIPLVPFVGGGYVLHGVMMPLIEEFGSSFEFLLYRHLEQMDAGDHVPSVCAKEWMRVPGRRVISLGHSAGGGSATLLAANLSRAGVPVELLVTIDGFPAAMPRPRLVRRWENYMQPLPVIMVGSHAPEAEVNKTLWPSNHISIAWNAAVRGSIGRQLRAMPAAGRP